MTAIARMAEEAGFRQRGTGRTRFHEWKRRFQTRGADGLKNPPPIHESHPPKETLERHRPE